jgi:RNA polymerase sigma-B factor
MTQSSDPDDLELFREFVATRQRSTRNRIVERHIGLAVHIAGRFGRSNIPNDDLRQVAMIGLVKAVDRFDPEFGAPFASFAGSTIEGELKRHFRDRDWMVRVPRSAQDLNRSVRSATDELSQDLGRSPTVDEVAAHLDVSRDEVFRGLAASAAHHVDALDSDGGARSTGPLADNEPGYEHVEDTNVAEALLVRLSERQQQIVRLRFYEQMSQAEIATALGMSQMQVSRLLRQSFSQMRVWLVEDQSNESS